MSPDKIIQKDDGGESIIKELKNYDKKENFRDNAYILKEL